MNPYDEYKRRKLRQQMVTTLAIVALALAMIYRWGC